MEKSDFWEFLECISKKLWHTKKYSLQEGCDSDILPPFLINAFLSTDRCALMAFATFEVMSEVVHRTIIESLIIYVCYVFNM